VQQPCICLPIKSLWLGIPKGKWTVCGKNFMSVQEIWEEEGSLQKEEVAHAWASWKRKHEVISISFLLAEEVDVIEEVVVSSGNDDTDGKSNSRWVIRPVAQEEAVQREEVLAKWWCWRVDHSIASCPRRRLIQQCGLVPVLWPVLRGWQRGETGKVVPYGDLGEGRTDFRHGIYWGQPLFQKKYFEAILKMHARIRAGKYMPGCLWIMSTAGA